MLRHIGTQLASACYSDNIVVLETPCNSGKNVKKVLLYACKLTKGTLTASPVRTACAARGMCSWRVLISGYH
jgi:hypothetical protein